MKKFFKIVIILIVFVIIGIDFYGLWKYKINGHKYVIETGSDDGEPEEPEDDGFEYETLTSEAMSNGEVLFIKNIEEVDESYEVKGILFKPYEISKDDYQAVKNGEDIELFGESYKKSQIKNNNLILKSTDSGDKKYYITYNTENKKYILYEAEAEAIVYKKTDKNVKVAVKKGTAFATVKNGKTTNKKVEDMIDTHKDLTEPSEDTASINTCTLTFNSSDVCTKITETIIK